MTVKNIHLLSFSVLLCIFCFHISKVFAGVTNPNISLIGQFSGAYTDDRESESSKKPTMELGETELQFDAALNPYFNGLFVFSLSPDETEVEEAYVTMVRGLPFNMALKGGKYRAGFGSLNQAHPHTYPFIRTPRVMDPGAAKLLPGEESFNETALEASSLIPVAGSYSILVSGDILQGDSFHPDSTAADFGWLARVANSFVIGDKALSEVGFSMTQGTNDPAKKTKSLIMGVDLKSKITVSPTLKLIVQSEFIYKNAKHSDLLNTVTHEKRSGFYTFADMRSAKHINGGILYEQYQDPDDDNKTNRAIKPYIGYAVLEESTLLQLTWEHIHAAGPDSGQFFRNTDNLQYGSS